MDFAFDPQKVPQGSVEVELPLSSLFSALSHATARMTFSMAMNLGQKDEAVKDNWTRRYATDLGGVLGEMALAYWMRWPEPPILNDFNHGSPDIPPDIEVRHTFHEQGGLIVRSKDDLSRRFVLVTGTGPMLYLVGWAIGREVAQGPPWKTNGNGQKVWLKSPFELYDMKSFELY